MEVTVLPKSQGHPFQLPNLSSHGRASSALQSEFSSPGRRALLRKREKSMKMSAQLKAESRERLNHRLFEGADGQTPRVATLTEVEHVAELLQRRTNEIILDPRARGWYKMFVNLDDDCSGKITYWELEDMVRNELALPRNQFPDEQLQAIWRALDADKSGLISCGEFGHFMRMGLKSTAVASNWKQKAFKASQARAAEIREERFRLQADRNFSMETDMASKRNNASTMHSVSVGQMSSRSSDKQAWRSSRAYIF
ncbi:unnamed protein product [Polarella glacialis]|uniref:EF-hand domain-containing protein n=1 Tax=Polarella glacialis TaxID=89957 RepID=A0A813HMV9_POLGL|nr:unnamed protein product [Polarella glacialis]